MPQARLLFPPNTESDWWCCTGSPVFHITLVQFCVVRVSESRGHFLWLFGGSSASPIFPVRTLMWLQRGFSINHSFAVISQNFEYSVVAAWVQYPPLHSFHFCVTKIQHEYLVVTTWVQYPPLHCFHFCVKRFSVSTWWWPRESSIPHYIVFISVLKDPIWVLGGDHVKSNIPHYIVFHSVLQRSSMSTWWWPRESSIRHYIVFISVLKGPLCVFGSDHVSPVSAITLFSFLC